MIHVGGYVTGDKEITAHLEALDKSFARRIIRKGVRKGIQIGAKMAKPYAPKKSGTLRKSIGSKVSKAKGGTRVAGVVGARYGFEKNGQDPTKYQHLVNRGTKPHSIAPKTKKVMAFRAGGRTLFSQTSTHPGTRPNAFLTRAYNASRSAVQSTVMNTIRAEIAIQQAKARPNQNDES